MEALLKSGHLDVEAEDFSCKGILCGELFSPQDTLLPRSLGHRAIMGLRLAAKQLRRLDRHPTAVLTVARPGDYIFGNFCTPSRFLM